MRLILLAFSQKEEHVATSLKGCIKWQNLAAKISTLSGTGYSYFDGLNRCVGGVSGFGPLWHNWRADECDHPGGRCAYGAF